MIVAISSTAASNASALRAEGCLKPLILRTYWRAAACASPVVAGPASSGRRSWRMLRHMPRRVLRPTLIRQFSLPVNNPR